MTKRRLDGELDFISKKMLKICLKRDREDEPPAPTNKRRMLETQLNNAKVDFITLKQENQRLRAEMDKKDKLIVRGYSEIKDLNAQILTLKHQLSMMEDYVRHDSRVFYIS